MKRPSGEKCKRGRGEEAVSSLLDDKIIVYIGAVIVQSKRMWCQVQIVYNENLNLQYLLLQPSVF